MIALTLILATSPVCEDLDIRVRQLEQATSAGDLAVLLDAAQGEAGVPLLSPAEADLDLAEQAQVASARLRTACDLHEERTAGASSADASKLKEILDSPEFAGARDRNPQALLQLLARIRDWLEALLGDRPAQAFASGVRLFVLVLAAIVVVLATWRLSRVRLAKSARPPEQVVPAPLVLLDPSAHLDRARTLVPTDPRGALREALFALLSELERRRLARPDRVKTNREIARELPERGAPVALSERVAELLAGYDRAFYSLNEVAPTTARSFTDQVEALRRSFEEAR